MSEAFVYDRYEELLVVNDELLIVKLAGFEALRARTARTPLTNSWPLSMPAGTDAR
jgi:hypothetical protein